MFTEIRHPAANEVIASGIFVGAADFRDIEERIARIETDAASHEKGKVFEVFAEALLANLEVVQAKNVWAPVANAPQEICERLNLRPRDKGIDLLDLVALTHGKDEAFWDEKTMKRLEGFFEQIDFGL